MVERSGHGWWVRLCVARYVEKANTQLSRCVVSEESNAGAAVLRELTGTASSITGISSSSSVTGISATRSAVGARAMPLVDGANAFAPRERDATARVESLFIVV